MPDIVTMTHAELVAKIRGDAQAQLDAIEAPASIAMTEGYTDPNQVKGIEQDARTQIASGSNAARDALDDSLVGAGSVFVPDPPATP